jgi:hypothetical protein
MDDGAGRGEPSVLVTMRRMQSGVHVLVRGGYVRIRYLYLNHVGFSPSAAVECVVVRVGPRF